MKPKKDLERRVIDPLEIFDRVNVEFWGSCINDPLVQRLIEDARRRILAEPDEYHRNQALGTYILALKVGASSRKRSYETS